MCLGDNVCRQIKALVEDKYMNHMKMSELEEQRSRLACEVECLKAAAKSSTQSEQQWKGFLYIFMLVLSLYTTRLACCNRSFKNRLHECMSE